MMLVPANPFSYPASSCTCGMQANGNFVPECPACAAYQEVHPHPGRRRPNKTPSAERRAKRQQRKKERR